MALTALWHDCLGQLQHELPAQQYNTWIRPLRADTEEGQLVLSAPNRFVKDWVKDKYLQRIQEILSELNGGRITHVELSVGESRPMFTRPDVTRAPADARPQPAPQPRQATEGYAFGTPREETGGAQDSDYSASAPAPANETSTPAYNNAPPPVRFYGEPPAAAKPKREVQVEGGLNHQSFLNPTFTFKTFVEGKLNNDLLDKSFGYEKN